MACVEEEEEEEEEGFFMPPFLRQTEAEIAEIKAGIEARLRQEAEQARKEDERRRRGAAHRAVLDSILERDPKTGREVYTRYSFTDFSIFDIDEESRIPPMRFTKTGYVHGLNLEDSANIISVKIVSSDRGFPINVYGTIIARDSVDHKCIYIFNRPMEDCQTINSVDESLILTGPGRGLVLLDFIYLEINLKIKVDGKPLGEQISKGLLGIDGRVQPRDEKVKVGSQTLKSWYSNVMVSYATILNAVECTLEIEVLKGHFCGEIKAGIEGVEGEIVIHSSKEDGVVTRGGKRYMKLRRHVMTICLEKMLAIKFVTMKGCRRCGRATRNATSGGRATRNATSERIETFTPQRRSEEEAKISFGASKFELKFVWSLMDILGRDKY
uniref:Uncharacterized protein n=1 Tax=Avena sativa TaxID=4498 RepID=A0ACD5W3L4_AVESA